MSVDAQQIELQLLNIVRQFLLELEAERAAQAISLDATLDRDLGIDSLGRVELFNRIEKSFTVHFATSDMAKAETLKDIIKLIQQAKPNLSTTTINQKNITPLANLNFDITSASTLREVIIALAEHEPQRPHLYFQNEQGDEQIIRYGELFLEAKKVANGLIERGIQPSETIAVMLPTSPEFFYAYTGILLAGAVPVPIYPPFRPDRIEEYTKREARILHNAQVRLLITFDRAELLSRILAPFIPSLKGVTTLKNLQSKDTSLPEISITADAPALIQYTSGSTGDPKGVLLTHQNMLANIHAIGKGLPVKTSDVIVSWLPLYHDMGLMNWLGSYYYGLPITILSPLSFLARPEQWLWAIHYHRATLSGGPNFAYELCVKRINPQDIEGLDLSSWRFAFNGAEAINPKTLKRFAEKFSPYGFKEEAFAPVYGLAESTVALTFPQHKRTPRIDRIERTAFEKEQQAILTTSSNSLEFVCCGEPLPDHQIRIVDDAGNILPERQIGNLEFTGPSAMQGYFNNPTATQKAYRDGWWATGDYGYLADKELFLIGRKKDLIIKAGRNIYPEEIEEVVGQVHGIRKGCVAAFGVTDPTTGTEKLIIVAETQQTDKQKLQQLRADITEQLVNTLAIPPDHLILAPAKSIPKTSSGKLKRSSCKELYLHGALTKKTMPLSWQLLKLSILGFQQKTFRLLSYLGRGIYTLYVIFLFLITLPWVWVSLFIFSERKITKIIKVWARLIFRFAGCPITVENQTQLKKSQPIIFAANHASYVDAFALLSVLPTGIIFTGKIELLKAPIIGTFIRKLGYLTIDRSDFSEGMAEKEKISRLIKDGKSVFIFPEGTFTYATGLRPFKMGTFVIAAETNTSICAVAIQGTRKILREGNFLPRPGKIKITLSSLIIPHNNSWEEAARLRGIVRQEIAKHCGEPAIDVITAGLIRK